MSQIDFNVVFVLGRPGAGKNIQCQKIGKEFGYVHLSAGDLIREERRNPGSQFGELSETYTKEGKIVPAEMACSLLERAMETSGKNNFLIDGFPKNQDDLEGWNRRVAAKVNLQFVLLLDCPPEVSIERAFKRGRTSGRPDDNLETIKMRMDLYLLKTQPIIDHYDKMNLVKKVDSTRPHDIVYDEIKKLFEKEKLGYNLKH